MAINDLRVSTLLLVSSVVLFGTFYSITNQTYLDTSNPLLTALPHPLYGKGHYFASKSNPLNVFFIKKAWAWTSVAFLALLATDPAPNVRIRRVRLTKYAVETAVWMAFAGWFFGPALLERLIAFSGGECVVVLPSGYIVKLPIDMCYGGDVVSPATHPSLFAATLLVPDVQDWKARPRLRRGHDVSGHVFLLTMGTLFLMDQMRMSLKRTTPWPIAHRYAYAFSAFIVLTSLFSLYTTSVYFHTPGEKFSGLALGIIGFLISQLHWFEPEPFWRPTATSTEQTRREPPSARRIELDEIKADVVTTTGVPE